MKIRDVKPFSSEEEKTTPEAESQPAASPAARGAQDILLAIKDSFTPRFPDLDSNDD